MKIGDRVCTMSDESVTLLHVSRGAPRRVATYAPDGSVCDELYPTPGALLECWQFHRVSIVLPLEEEEER